MPTILSEETKTFKKKLADQKEIIEKQYNKVMEDEIAKMKAELSLLLPFSEIVFNSSAILQTDA